MSYGAFRTAPWSYRANYHAQDVRSHQAGWESFLFGANDDTSAAAVAAVADGVTVAQRTSLTKRLGEHNLQAAHPAGTRLSVKILVIDGTGVSYRFQLRNLKTGIDDSQLSNLFLGNIDAGADLAALSGPPSLVTTGGAVVTVVNTIVDKSG